MKTMLEKSAKRLNDILDLYPLEEGDPVQMNENSEMKEGLARLWADKGVRAYLENARKIAQSNINAVKNKDPMEYAMESIYYKARLDTLTSILIKAKDCFKNYNQLRFIANKQKNKEKKEKQNA